MAGFRALALLFVASALPAQPVGGTLRGILTDSSGAVIPSASISLEGANLQKKVRTPANGSYIFGALPPGRYTIKVEFPGFDPFESMVTIESGSTTDLPIQLTLQAGRQEVTVTGERGPELSTDPGQSAVKIYLTHP